MKYIKILFVMAGVILALTGCGKSDSEKNSGFYGDIIEKLDDDEQFALEDIGEKNYVLFTTDATYDDGWAHNAAIYCNVYYAIDGETYDLGRIESMGTAYPISYGKKCIYTASQNSLEIYVIDTANHQLALKEQYVIEYGEGDEIFYYRIKDGEKEAVSEKDYLKIQEEHEKSSVISFSYGASDSTPSGTPY